MTGYTINEYLNRLMELCRINLNERPLYECEKFERDDIIKKLSLCFTTEVHDPYLRKFLDILWTLF